MSAFTRTTISPEELALVDEAIEVVSRTEDHSFHESDLIAEIVARLPAKGTPGDRERKARKLMEAHNKQGGMSLLIPGAPRKPDIPPEADADVVTAILDLTRRGMAHDDIRQMIVAHHPAITIRTYMASWESALEQMKWDIDTETVLHELFAKWDAEERAKGRPVGDLVFGNFVRETGLLVAGRQH